MLFRVSPDNELLPTLTYSHGLSRIIDLPCHPRTINPSFPYNKKLQAALQGKKLLLEETNFSLEEIQTHYRNGYCTYQPAMIKNHKQIMCVRCGNNQLKLFASFHCARCRRKCTYCRNCVMMGRLSECTPLLSWTGPDTPIPAACRLDWQGTLSSGQQHASEKIVAAVEQSMEMLVWAVCGAGKTELLFKGMERALQLKKRVCIATPRTDVVLELAPRLQQVFPDINVIALYGGSEDKLTYSPLLISTTHQLYRYEKAFDLVILDEMDAFPYSVDKTLQYAVRKARKQNSSMVYLTATPNKSWQRKCQDNKIDYVTIPARFHQHPLPVPQFVWCGNWEKKLHREKLPFTLLTWLKERLITDRQVLLFLPKIAYLQKVMSILSQLDSNIESVYAADPMRVEKVKRMRNKEIKLLITTTILERGVTFPNIDVAVLGAEDAVFTASALIQIAGRAGRSVKNPFGDVAFFHYGKTKSMVEAKQQITNSNKEAAKKGMLLPGMGGGK